MSEDCNVRMLIREGHAGYIIGKSGARIKELRLVVIYMFLHCLSSCYMLSVWMNNLLLFLSQCVIQRFNDEKCKTLFCLMYYYGCFGFIAKNLIFFYLLGISYGHRMDRYGIHSLMKTSLGKLTDKQCNVP